MGYVAVTGGQDAIDASIELLREYRSGGKLPVDTEILRDRMKLLIDRVMSEAGLYAPDYAALALKQCEGSTEEAVFLLRAYRSTLSRNYTSRTVHGDEMHIRRRISSAFKDIPGGQMLGPTYDYVHRLLNFSLTEEKEEELQQWRAAFEEKAAQAGEVSLSDTAPRVLDLLRQEGLLEQVQEDRSEPCDVTMENLPLTAPRSAILQTLTRRTQVLSPALLTAISAVSACPTPPLGNSGTGAWKLKWTILWKGAVFGTWVKSLSQRWRV